MKKERLIQVARLQDNLSTVRKLAGLTSAELGEILGVSKQNISSLENGNTRLSQAQYIAIRHILEYKAKMKPVNLVLPRLIYLLVDRTDIKGRDYNMIKKAAMDISMASMTMSGKSLIIFSETILKSCYLKASDGSLIEGILKNAIESDDYDDWTIKLLNI